MGDASAGPSKKANRQQPSRETSPRDEQIIPTSMMETTQQKVAQIYVRSESGNTDETEEPRPDLKDNTSITDYAYDNIGREFSMSDELQESPDGTNSEVTETTSVEDFTYKGLCYAHRKSIADDITTGRKFPNILVEIIGSVFNIINLVIAFKAFHDISFATTGVRYLDFMRDDGAQYHGEELEALNGDVNYDTIHIYKESVYKSWRNFVYLGLCLTGVELVAPVFRILVVTDRGPKKVRSAQTLLQLTLLVCLVLGDGAVSLCKNMLFTEECGIRSPMMSPISKLSASLSFTNTIIKTVLFVWRSSFQNKRVVRDEMEAYMEILILEEYQWQHCVIPILSHIAIMCLSAWSLIDATTTNLLCTNQN